MEDIVMRVARLYEEKNIPNGVEHHERFVRAMEAASECVDAECRATGKQLSEAEREAARDKYFRIEATKMGIPPDEIEGQLYVWTEIQKILAEVTQGKAT